MRREIDDRELVGLVLEFARQVNALQRRYAPLLAEARKEGRMAVLLADYRKAAEAVRQRWLTRRRRSGHIPLPDPPAYAAVERLAFSTVERGKDRATVEILTSEGCLDFRFKLLYRDGEWRVDSCQRRYHSEGRVDQWHDGVF